MSVILSNHQRLHETVARTTLAAGAASVAGMFLSPALATAAMALAVGVAVAVPRSITSAVWLVLLACLAGAAVAVGGPAAPALAAIAVGASMARGVDGTWRRLMTAGFGALGVATAGLIGRAVGQSVALAVLPSGIESLLAGVAGGFVAGVSSLGRHLERAAVPVENDLESLEGEGDLGRLLARAGAAYRETVAALGSDAPQARSAADDLIRRMASFGKRWREVELEAARSVPADVTLRLSEIEAQIAKTTDPVARTEFERAREALLAQLAYLEEIARGRERAVARLTHQVATLERLRLATVRHRSVDAARLGAELQPVVEELTQAGSELDVAAEALTEAAQAALPAARIPN